MKEFQNQNMAERAGTRCVLPLTKIKSGSSDEYQMDFTEEMLNGFTEEY